MGFFDFLFILCLSGVILSFCGSNFGLSFLSDHIRCALDYDTKIHFKINDDQAEVETSTISRKTETDSRNGSFAKISLSGNAEENSTSTDGLNDDDVTRLLQRFADPMNDVQESQDLEKAFKETVANVISNEMLRKAFFQDMQGAQVVDALRNIFDRLPSTEAGGSESN